MPRDEALRRASIEFGGVERAKEECREARGLSFIDSLLQDLRFGLRMMRKNFGFTATAILALALGIGVNTIVFTGNSEKRCGAGFWTLVGPKKRNGLAWSPLSRLPSTREMVAGVRFELTTFGL